MSLGPLGGHMAQHIVLMNLLAPLLALVLPRFLPPKIERAIALATIAQLTLIWGWHAPGALEAAMHEPILHLAMQVSLFAGALWFWCAVRAVGGSGRWKPILALLITGKLFCLLGVLFTFSPRLLYAAGHCGVHPCPAPDLADQHLAGLLMIVACPATYILAAVIIASRWLLNMEPADRGKLHV